MENDNNKTSFRTIWSAIMAVVYFALAYLVVFTSFPYNINEERTTENDSVTIIRVILGVTLFLYGLFRVFRIVKFRK